MDVKFYTTTAAKLSTLPVANGQLIFLEDKDSGYYDMGNSRRPLSGVKVGTRPSTGQSDILYVVIDADGKATASVWDATASTYRTLTSSIATTAAVGLVKPDGTTITIDNNGTISCHAEVTTLAASAITYDNTSSGMTADDAQEAIDELDTAVGQAQSDATDALTAIGTINGTLGSMETRLQAVEAIAARALITEDPVTP